MENRDKIESILRNQEFSDCKWINPQEFAVSRWVRVKCSFGCGDYGSGTGPPNTINGTLSKYWTINA